MIDPELVRWIIDETLCLRHRGARVVLLLTRATWKINYNYIAGGTYCYIDACLAANQHSTGEYSCKGLHHNLTTIHHQQPYRKCEEATIQEIGEDTVDSM